MEYICQICSKICKSIPSLSNHIHTHIKNNEIESLEHYYIKYIIKNDTEGLCEHCCKKTKFKSILKGYDRHCNHECSSKNSTIKKIKKENTENSLLKKYGVKNASQIVGNSNKVKKTKLERYENETYNNSLKNKETNLKNHNGIFSTGTLEYKEKYKETCLNKYGTEHHTQSNIIKNKYKITCFKKYNVEHPMKNEAYKQNTLLTFNNKYGGVLKGSKILSDKIKQTILSKYGVENIMQVEDIFNKNMSSRKSTYKLRKYTLKNNSDINYQSNMELEFIKYCEDNNIPIENGDKIKYYHNNKTHYYYVDFKIKINDKYQLIEIKGKTKWYYKSLKNGILSIKTNSAIKYSKNNNYLPYKLLLNYKYGKMKLF